MDHSLPRAQVLTEKALQEIRSSFFKKYTNCLHSAGKALFLLGARQFPPTGTQAVPRLPLKCATVYPQMLQGPEREAQQETHTGGPQSNRDWSQGCRPRPGSPLPDYMLPPGPVPGIEKVAGMAGVASQAGNHRDQIQVHGVILVLPAAAKHHTSWGSQMFTSLHICTTPVPKAISFIIHGWAGTHPQQQDESVGNQGPSGTFPPIPASVCQCLHSAQCS